MPWRKLPPKEIGKTLRKYQEIVKDLEAKGLVDLGPKVGSPYGVRRRKRVNKPYRNNST